MGIGFFGSLRDLSHLKKTTLPSRSHCNKKVVHLPRSTSTATVAKKHIKEKETRSPATCKASFRIDPRHRHASQSYRRAFSRSTSAEMKHGEHQSVFEKRSLQWLTLQSLVISYREYLPNRSRTRNRKQMGIIDLGKTEPGTSPLPLPLHPSPPNPTTNLVLHSKSKHH